MNLLCEKRLKNEERSQKKQLNDINGLVDTENHAILDLEYQIKQNSLLLETKSEAYSSYVKTEKRNDYVITVRHSCFFYNVMKSEVLSSIKKNLKLINSVFFVRKTNSI